MNNYDFLHLIMLRSSSKDIIEFCKVNRITRDISSTDHFWKKKFKRDFSSSDLNLIDKPPEELNWKRFYILFSQSKLKLVTLKIYNYDYTLEIIPIKCYIGKIWIFASNNMNDILYKIIKCIEPDKYNVLYKIYFGTTYSQYSYTIKFPLFSIEYMKMFELLSTIQIHNDKNLFDIITDISIFA